MHQVTSSLEAHGTRRSDQKAVWSAIAEKSARLGAESDTAAMAAMYEKLDHSLEDFIAAFPPVDRQVEGEDVRLSGRDVIGAALIARGLAIHLCAFMTVSEA